MSRVPLLSRSSRPLLFAHRGCSSLAPENTMASFRLAEQYGAPGLELDVHLSADGELVVIHDDSLRRTAGSPEAVSDLRLEDLKRLDAGGWFSDQYAGERIPTLKEVLDEFAGRLYIDIELKTRKASGDPLPGRLAEELRRRRLETGVTISSFNPLALKAFKKAAPEYATAIIWCADKELPAYLRRGEGRWLSACDYLKPIHLKATPLSLALLGSLGRRPVVPWTVDDPILARTLIDRGCAGVITNRCQDLVPALIGA